MVTRTKTSNVPDEKNQKKPRQVRLPGFISEEEIGIGDVIKRVTSRVGIKPCGGCNRRAEMLNRWMMFTR